MPVDPLKQYDGAGMGTSEDVSGGMIGSAASLLFPGIQSIFPENVTFSDVKATPAISRT